MSNLEYQHITDVNLVDNNIVSIDNNALRSGQILETILRLTATIITSATAPVGSGLPESYLTQITLKGTHVDKGEVTLVSLSGRELYEKIHFFTRVYPDRAVAGVAVSTTYNVLVDLPLHHLLSDMEGNLSTILAGEDWSKLEVEIKTGSIDDIYTTANGATISSAKLTISQQKYILPILENPPLLFTVRKILSLSAGTITPIDILYQGAIRGFLLHTQIAGVDSDAVLDDIHITENATQKIWSIPSFGALKTQNKTHFNFETMPTGYGMIDFLSKEFLPVDMLNGYIPASLNLNGTVANAGTLSILPIYIG